MLEELQVLDAGQLETTQIETRPVGFAEGDVAALKPNWKHYLEPFFLAILREDLHHSNDCIFERTMRISWLAPSQEDPLYIFTIQYPVPLFSLCTKSLIAVLKDANQLSEENGGGPFC